MLTSTAGVVAFCFPITLSKHYLLAWRRKGVTGRYACVHSYHVLIISWSTNMNHTQEVYITCLVRKGRLFSLQAFPVHDISRFGFDTLVVDKGERAYRPLEILFHPISG